MEEEISENGIQILVKENHDKPTTCSTFYNPVMKICREFVLCCLATHVEKVGGPIKCLEAFGATGIGGLLWKRHLAERVVVTINDKDPTAVKEIQNNIRRNGFKQINSSADDRVEPCRPDVISETLQGPEYVEVTEGDCNVLMHQRQYSFIHLDPYGCTVQYLDAAFRNIYNQGVIVITATDVTALYGKQPQVTMRNYGAYTVKTDYTKELAVRVLLGAATRSAARCNKGFDVLYSVGVEHFLQVALRIKRGPSRADTNIQNIYSVLHCRICEDWALIPNNRAPTENPYSLLPCCCHDTSPGKTALELGPMWMGSIFCSEFTAQMKQTSVKLSLSNRIQGLLHTMHEESICPDLHQGELLEKQCKEQQRALREKQDGNDHQVETQDTKNVGKSGIETSETVKSVAKDDITTKDNNGNKPCLNETVMGNKSIPDVTGDRGNTSVKRTLEDNSNNCVARKKMRLCCHGDNAKILEHFPSFFYNTNKRKIKGVDVPKAHKLVALMRRQGFRASRTHFDTLGLRTDATLRELTDILTQQSSQNNKKT